MKLRIHRLAVAEIDHEVDYYESCDRFPFTLVYQIKAEEIVILALAHTSRSPGYWSRRR